MIRPRLSDLREMVRRRLPGITGKLALQVQPEQGLLTLYQHTIPLSKRKHKIVLPFHGVFRFRAPILEKVYAENTIVPRAKQGPCIQQ